MRVLGTSSEILFSPLIYRLVLIYDFTVTGQLKIKLVSYVCFHRSDHKTTVFRPLTSCLISFFTGLGACNQSFKTKYCIFPVTGEGKIFSSKNDHKTFINAHLVWCLISGFSSVYSASQLQDILTQKHSHSRYYLNNILERKSAAKISQQMSQQYKSNNKQVTISTVPVNQMCLFASMDNSPPETGDIKRIILLPITLSMLFQ